LTWLLLGLLIGVVAAGFYGYERQAAVYEQLVRTVETQRDHAIAEMKVFRGLLFPVINRAAEAASEGAVREAATHPPTPLVQPSKLAAPAPSHSASPLMSRRLPFRMRFNQARKQTNTPQIKHDALADALAKQKTSATQKPQEKKENVSA
jgi:hypothetical protein